MAATERAAPARLPTPALAATAAAVTALTGEAAAASPVDPGRRCSTCLVVEDEAMIRMLVCELLEEAGFAVAAAGDAAAALGAFLAAPADQPWVLVTDINLGPGADGVALAAAARRLRPGLPVVYVTANPDRVAAARRGSPDDRVVAKPFDSEALVRTVVDAAAAAGAGRPRSDQ
jgi:CheY-like chemotaxis protein